MEHWEKYAKKIFGPELEQDHTPSMFDDDNQDSITPDGDSSEAHFKIICDTDGIPIFPDLDSENIPKLPLRKKIIRTFLSMHYRKSFTSETHSPYH
jgi:hypothetical protein